MKAQFVVHGEPQGKARHRMTRAGRTYTPAKTVKYEKLVRDEYETQCWNIWFDDGTPLTVLIDAYLTIPKSTSKKRLQQMADKIIRPVKKPDWDNVGKIICDSLNGVAYHDDSQIVDGRVRKFYGTEPFVVVTIEEI